MERLQVEVVNLLHRHATDVRTQIATPSRDASRVHFHRKILAALPLHQTNLIEAAANAFGLVERQREEKVVRKHTQHPRMIESSRIISHIETVLCVFRRWWLSLSAHSLLAWWDLIAYDLTNKKHNTQRREQFVVASFCPPLRNFSAVVVDWSLKC